jgi:hypothetical protein
MPVSMRLTRRHPRWALAALACAAIVSCTGSGGALSDAIPASPGAGLPGGLITEQPLDAPGLSSATPADPVALKAFLGTASFQSAYTRIWGSSEDYVTMIAARFDTGAHATGLVSLERKQVTGHRTFVADYAKIPGSFVFVLSGQTRSGGHPVLCNGVWFAVASDAVEVLACGNKPAYASSMEALADREYQKLQAGT